VKEYEREDFVSKVKKDEEIPKQMNDFPFVDNVCPASAHIRKTNPQRIFGGGIGGGNDGDTRANRSRIIRNGIPYGTDYSATDLTKRGLLFACYQANIEDGFQNMQQTWCNEPKFPVSGTGQDPIVGQVKQVDGSGNPPQKVNGLLTTGVTVRDKYDPKIIKPKNASFQQLVTLKGGDYFFVPPISEMKDKGRLVTTKPATT
jgi:deferrochelatase/peroxidase EfeB